MHFRAQNEQHTLILTLCLHFSSSSWICILVVTIVAAMSWFWPWISKLDCLFDCKVFSSCNDASFLLSTWFCWSMSFNFEAEILMLSWSKGITWHNTSTWLINAVDESEDCLGVIASTPLDFAICSNVWEIKYTQSECNWSCEAGSVLGCLRGVKNISALCINTWIS